MSFEEAEQAEIEYYHSLTPQDRLEILFELNRRSRETTGSTSNGRIEKVYRIVRLEESTED